LQGAGRDKSDVLGSCILKLSICLSLILQRSNN
jgi:hypothetical protein